MGSLDQTEILANYLYVIEQIEAAAASVGRNPKSVKLVVVTKGHPVETINRALQSGIRMFGENYAEEGLEKILACRGQPGIEWHMIGHVQSRKAGLVCQHFDWVHSLDSLKLAQRFDRLAAGYGRKLPVLMECNVSGEESKFGWSAWDENHWEMLLPEISQIARLPNLDLRGLMTMAPFFDDPEPARPYFQRLARLRVFLRQNLPEACWDELSMGMSGDFTVAVQEGASLVRVGTAILGPRYAA